MSKDERAKTARVVLVRHGEGRANVDGVIAGLSSCKGLTELGHSQVEGLSTRWSREGFRPDALYSSPVQRARETAEILPANLPGLVVVDDCDLCEMHNGEADGLTWQEYDARYGRFNIMEEPSRTFAPGAESWDDVMGARPTSAAELATPTCRGDSRVVTHSGLSSHLQRCRSPCGPTTPKW